MIPGSVDPGVLALVYVSLHLGNSSAAMHDGLTSNTMQADISYSYHEFGSYRSSVWHTQLGPIGKHGQVVAVWPYCFILARLLCH